ncbi:MAG: ATP-grasp domain-containing protein [Bacteroidetes bacterium]|nr:MAG: ATP-grasp domain-containing protein [Bacteroidota bacterium]
MTFLCVSFYFKGSAFLEACAAAGNTVYLLTKKSLENQPWPRESITEIFYLEDDANTPQNFEHMRQGFAWLLREKRIDRIVALDDFDVEKAAFLREEFRIPGMGQTTARYFRDKLAMRIRAAEAGIPVPPFSSLFNNDDINHYADTVAPPWVIKPRAEASATGIKKVHHKQALWDAINALGDDRPRYLVEQFLPGDVYHVDALTQEGKLEFCQVSKYLNTPFEVAHGGGIFRSQTVPYRGVEDESLQKLTAEVMTAFGMKFSASHTEYIRAHADGKFYFLETSSRVGGAHLAEMVEVASGINLWAEWAKLETAVARGETYQVPRAEQNHAGILISLARYEHPDTSTFNDPEIVWRLDKPYHVGLIVKSDSCERVTSLLDAYAERVFREFHASAPVPDKPLD